MTKPDIAEARRLADLAWPGAVRGEPNYEARSAAMLRALADELERLWSAYNEVEALGAQSAAELERLRAQVAQCRDALALAPDWQLTKQQRLIVNAARDAADSAAPAQQAGPVMLNGLTEAETSSTASVAGLAAQAAPSPTVGGAVYVSRTSLEWLLDDDRSADASITTQLFKVGDKDTVALHLQPAAQAEPVAPSGYAYRYADGLRFNGGCEVNGSRPIEAVPYFFAPPHPPAQGVGDELGPFEEWAADEAELMSLPNAWAKDRYSGDYTYAAMRVAWHAWKARAALAQAPATKEQP